MLALEMGVCGTMAMTASPSWRLIFRAIREEEEIAPAFEEAAIMLRRRCAKLLMAAVGVPAVSGRARLERITGRRGEDIAS